MSVEYFSFIHFTNIHWAHLGARYCAHTGKTISTMGVSLKNKNRTAF